MIESLILCLAAVAAVAGGTSALVGLGAVLGGARARRWTGATRARVLLALVAAPAILSLLGVLVALLPSMGFGHDHCEAHGLHHPHLCFGHAAGAAGWVAAALGALLVARLAAALLRALGAMVDGVRAARGLPAAAPGRGGSTVVPGLGMQAFVLGFLRPRVYVGRELSEASSGRELAVVLAHEAAHATRRDPLRRLVAMVLLGFHLPGIARRLERALALSHEMAADDAAAEAAGSAAEVAEALVRVARRRRAPVALAAWGGADLARRVQRLLLEEPRVEAASPWLLLGLGVGLAGLLVMQGERVHHALEILLGWMA